MTSNAASHDGSVLVEQVIDATRRLRAPGSNATLGEIGRDAWAHLTEHQRAEALPLLLGVFAGRIRELQVFDQHDIDATTPDLTTLLRPTDLADGWSAFHRSVPADNAVIDRWVLRGLLEEIEMLHRRKTPNTTEAQQ